jgi:hypothetical protein
MNYRACNVKIRTPFVTIYYDTEVAISSGDGLRS